jgi:hypothetical protein
MARNAFGYFRFHGKADTGRTDRFLDAADSDDFDRGVDESQPGEQLLVAPAKRLDVLQTRQSRISNPFAARRPLAGSRLKLRRYEKRTTRADHE